MPLSFVNRPWRPMPLFAQDPAIEVHRDCIYVPIHMPVNFWENPHWGVYDSDGRNIDAAAHHMLPNMGRSGQSDIIDVEVEGLDYAPCQRYFYVGNILNHYGHFLCSSMSRLWALPHSDVGRVPLIGHAAGNPDAWFSWPHASALFGSAGIVKEDFASFDRPVRIRELVVARPSFVELNHAHVIHAECAHRWGDRLVVAQDLSPKLEIVYLSKERLSRDLPGIRNEAALVEGLKSVGVPIIYPEQMPLSTQVALFRRTKRIIGQSGSAFHTSILSPPRPDHFSIIINHNPNFISDNHAMMDAINLSRSYYVYFDLDLQDDKGGLNIKDPGAAARELIDLAYNIVA